MAAVSNILYLVHRLPYPPNKGDKVRSYHLLRHLQKNHRVFLGTFIDDPDDEQHLSALQALCGDLHVERIDVRSAKLKSLSGLLTGEALTLAYYRNAGMQRWVAQIAATHSLQACVVFSSAMAQYAQPLLRRVPMLVDFVDVDSAKWTQYASVHRWPLSMLYRREGLRLLAYERAMAAQARCSYFVTPNETALFVSQAPECEGRVQAMGNGVDSDFFKPDFELSRPFETVEQAIVFTGAMDYWPNIDGVSWFVVEMLPRLIARFPRARFYIVGRSPSPQVRAMAGAHVVVTGTVPDVRPYLQHASAVVAPLRVARGIQNKILEAMAMQQPVVTVSSCADAIGATAEQGLLRADTPDEFVQALQPLLESSHNAAALGRQARRYVEQECSWQAHLSGIDSCLNRARAMHRQEAGHV
ncbi:TIGR03087 family PEP-CTERM/XrtA system glycosyltransferase [Alicycliphilus denitrificans]|uniref:TIGR03087 family PEP-CTERM/XrtA system glycosyltransferase n=1 Tax=Alicycliphilus denitrificans TaxID=179636 RepID=UPI00384BB5AA